MKAIYKVYLALCLWLGVCNVLPAFAQNKQEADNAYAREQYQKASQIYSQLLQKGGKSPELFFNLGDCYYRMGDMTKAVISFQRARQLAPGDKKIRHNLRLAQSKLTDQIAPQSEMFFVTWTKDWRDAKTADGWAVSGIVAFILLLAFTAVYLFGQKVWLRKTGFFAALFCLFLTIVYNVFAFQVKALVNDTPLAVVTAAAMNVNSTPSPTSNKLFELHEGTSVRVIDNSMKDWKEVKLQDGRTGWVRASQLEMI